MIEASRAVGTTTAEGVMAVVAVAAAVGGTAGVPHRVGLAAPMEVHQAVAVAGAAPPPLTALGVRLRSSKARMGTCRRRPALVLSQDLVQRGPTPAALTAQARPQPLRQLREHGVQARRPWQTSSRKRKLRLRRYPPRSHLRPLRLDRQRLRRPPTGSANARKRRTRRRPAPLLRRSRRRSSRCRRRRRPTRRR